MDEDFDARKKRRAMELEAKKKKLEELRRLKKERQQRRSQVRALLSRGLSQREVPCLADVMRELSIG